MSDTERYTEILFRLEQKDYQWVAGCVSEQTSVDMLREHGPDLSKHIYKTILDDLDSSEKSLSPYLLQVVAYTKKAGAAIMERDFPWHFGYVAKIEPPDNGTEGYWVSFPDLPEMEKRMTDQDNINNAADLARTLLVGYVSTKVLSAQSLPKPRYRTGGDRKTHRREITLTIEDLVFS